MTGKYIDVTKNKTTPASVRVRQQEMSFDIKTNPNHAMAPSADFADAEPTWYDGFDIWGMDYTNLLATVFVTTDTVVKVSTEISPQGSVDNRRQLVIDVPDVELWYIADNTVIDVDSLGELVEYSGGNILRDDTEVLRNVCAAACAWYGVKRNKITLRIDDVNAIAKIGEMITDVRVVDDGTPSQTGTIVTSVTQNFRQRTTVIQTDFVELDLAAAWRGQGISNTPTLAVAGRQIAKLNKDVRDTRIALGRKPDKVAIGGGSAVGNSVQRAKAQENAQTDGTLSVKLVDSDGAVTGDAFDVYVFKSKATTNYTAWVSNETGIPIATNDYLLVTKCFGDWFLVSPVLLKIGTKTDTVSSTADTIGGRIIYNWLEEW